MLENWLICSTFACLKVNFRWLCCCFLLLISLQLFSIQKAIAIVQPTVLVHMLQPHRKSRGDLREVIVFRGLLIKERSLQAEQFARDAQQEFGEGSVLLLSRPPHQHESSFRALARIEIQKGMQQSIPIIVLDDCHRKFEEFRYVIDLVGILANKPDNFLLLLVPFFLNFSNWTLFLHTFIWRAIISILHESVVISWFTCISFCLRLPFVNRSLIMAIHLKCVMSQLKAVPRITESSQIWM